MSLGSPRPYKSRVRVDVDLDANGLPTGASAVGRVEASPAEVFALLGAFDRYPGRVPMIHHARRVGHRVHVGLRFKVALFSTGFEFVADIHEEPGKFMELRWVSGEPRDLVIRHDLSPLDDGRATEVRTYLGFDINSLGWLVKYFLRHHPEIQFGVLSGSALALLYSLQTAQPASGR